MKKEKLNKTLHILETRTTYTLTHFRSARRDIPTDRLIGESALRPYAAHTRPLVAGKVNAPPASRLVLCPACALDALRSRINERAWVGPHVRHRCVF